MPKLEGFRELETTLRGRARQSALDMQPSVTVGYTQAYAVYVHENLESHHPVGQAKFIEQPARMLRDRLARIVKDALLAGKRPVQALLLAGLTLQRESMRLCPVLTGALRASAFTRVNKPG